MHPRLFPVVLSTIFCFSFVCGSPVEPKNVTETSKLVPANIPVSAVTTVSPLTKEHADLKPENKTVDVNSEHVISNKTAESLNVTEPEPVVPKTNITTSNTTTIVTNSTNTNTKNSTVIPILVNDNSSTPTVPTAKTIAPTEVTPSTPTTVTVSSTETHTVTILPASKVEEKEKDHGFDGSSFIGGIVLALGLTGIGFVAYKFWKSRTESNYRNF